MSTLQCLETTSAFQWQELAEARAVCNQAEHRLKNAVQHLMQLKRENQELRRHMPAEEKSRVYEATPLGYVDGQEASLGLPTHDLGLDDLDEEYWTWEDDDIDLDFSSREFA